TKPTQHSVKQLLEAGVSPDVLICRTRDPLSENAKRKISLFCNVHESAVISAHDVGNVYNLPLMFDEEGLGNLLLKRLSLQIKRKDMSGWKKIVGQMERATKTVRIAMVGKYIRFPDTYLSINEALKHAAGVNDCKVEIDWMDAERFEKSAVELASLRDYGGILIPGGFGQRGSEGKVAAISYAKDHSIPFLGLCFGFQLAVVEFARSMGLKRANSTELDVDTPYPVIGILPEQDKVSGLGGTMRLGAHDIRIARGTRAYQIYGKEKIQERHRHRYEVNPKYIERLTKNGLKFSGKSLDGRRMEILELPEHRFFMATQFHPEFKSRPGKPSPVFEAFVKAALGKM
ncbi:MAG TPA: CTP synthase, partial [Bacteroidetes bacterium]|nr:CTP synthase [Bacteroidota bacterium]